MSHTIACPSCERTLRVPESLLGQQVKCPTCSHTFAAPDSIEETPPRRPAPPPEEPRPRRSAPPPEEDYEEPRPRRRRPREGDDYEEAPLRRRRDEKPSKVQAIAIMTLIGGILSLLFALGLIASCFGLLWPGTYYAVVLGIMGIIKGSQLMGEKAYRETPPSTIAVMMIINIINADVINLTMGILILIFLGDREVKDYFRR